MRLAAIIAGASIVLCAQLPQDDHLEPFHRFLGESFAMYSLACSLLASGGALAEQLLNALAWTEVQMLFHDVITEDANDGGYLPMVQAQLSDYYILMIKLKRDLNVAIRPDDQGMSDVFDPINLPELTGHQGFAVLKAIESPLVKLTAQKLRASLRFAVAVDDRGRSNVAVASAKLSSIMKQTRDLLSILRETDPDQDEYDLFLAFAIDFVHYAMRFIRWRPGRDQERVSKGLGTLETALNRFLTDLDYQCMRGNLIDGSVKEYVHDTLLVNMRELLTECKIDMKIFKASSEHDA
jgi:hypothetical protein